MPTPREVARSFRIALARGRIRDAALIAWLAFLLYVVSPVEVAIGRRLALRLLRGGTRPGPTAAQPPYRTLAALRDCIIRRDWGLARQIAAGWWTVRRARFAVWRMRWRGRLSCLRCSFMLCLARLRLCITRTRLRFHEWRRRPCKS